MFSAEGFETEHRVIYFLMACPHALIYAAIGDFSQEIHFNVVS